MKKSKVASPHSCNLLQVGSEFRQLWQFNTRNGHVSLVANRKIAAQDPLPAKVVAKDWSTLFQRKLNIAWLPEDQVFLRVVHLPAADLPELLSMVELQLEKLSPLPVAQIVWSVELGPKTENNLQPMVVVIAARDVVEEFLGKLEGSGFLVDRLEVPSLHQILEGKARQDGVWVYPTLQAGAQLCLLAWWSGGLLQQLQLLHLAEGESRASLVVEQLTKTAWAGEMEGWLALPTRCHLVADAASAPLWEPALSQWAGGPIEVSEPFPEGKLGELAVRRVSLGETNLNLLPPEYAARYRQQFVDRLWMGGLGAVLGIYCLGVLIYFAALQVVRFQSSRVESQVAAISNDFTNAFRLRERIEVLQNQLHLKYAALDCFKAVSEKLPMDLTLISFQFVRGQKVTLQGNAPPGQTVQITDYTEALQNYKVDGQPLFSNVGSPKWVTRPGPAGSQTLIWDFSCELTRMEKR